MNDDSLIDLAWQAREQAYAPYSKFKVGAAVLTTNGMTFPGCNMENLSYGLTLCAERVALGSMVAAGHRSLLAIAVVADTSEPISPCGACRQVLAEFGDCRLILVARAGVVFHATLRILFPRAKVGILDFPAADVPRGTTGDDTPEARQLT